MVTLTIQLIDSFAGFCALKNLRITDVQDDDRLLVEIADCPDAQATLTVMAGRCDLLIEADGYDAARFQQVLSTPEVYVMMILAKAEELYVTSDQDDVAVDFDGNVRQHLGPDGRPVLEVFISGDPMRTFDAHGRSEWLWRGWQAEEPICQHSGTSLAITAMAATSRDGRTVLRVSLVNVPANLRVITSTVGSHQIQARLLQDPPLSDHDIEYSTLGQVTDAVQLPPTPSPSAAVELTFSYECTGHILGVLAFVPGGPFVYGLCPID
ncbi:MAG: hypothetical protein AAFV53_21815 [Myxococcota bacterium]